MWLEGMIHKITNNYYWYFFSVWTRLSSKRYIKTLHVRLLMIELPNEIPIYQRDICCMKMYPVSAAHYCETYS